MRIISAEVIDRLGVSELILVTSDFHRDRAEYLFRKKLPKLIVTMSCSKTCLPEEELEKRTWHEMTAFNRLRNAH